MVEAVEIVGGENVHVKESQYGGRDEGRNRKVGEMYTREVKHVRRSI